MPKFFNRCCNPTDIERHNVKISLRRLPEYLRIHYRLSTKDRVCSACYKKLLKQYTKDSEESAGKPNESFTNIREELIDVGESQDANMTGTSSIFYPFLYVIFYSSRTNT